MNGLLRFLGIFVIGGQLLVAARTAAQPPQPAQPAGANPLKPGEKPALPRIDNPSVRALLNTNPTTPEELVQAIDLLIDLQHVPVAKQLLNQLLALNLEENKLAELGRKFGTATFLKLSLVPELNPEARQFADAVTNAAAQQARDPARLAGLVNNLKEGSPAERRRATIELRMAGPAGTEALLAVLLDPQRAAEHAQVRTALVGQGSAAIAPLLAILHSGETGLKLQAIDILRRMQATDAVPFLFAPAASESAPAELQTAARQALHYFLGHVPQKREAASMLYAQARSSYEAAAAATGEPVQIWSYVPGEKQVVAKMVAPRVAALTSAGNLASGLTQLLPDSAVVRRLYLGSLLEAAAYAADLNQPLPRGEGSAFDQAAAAGPQAIVDLLSHSLREGHLPAVLAALEVLSEIGKPDLLYQRGSQPSVLVEAAGHSEQRIRFAALSVIMKLQAPQPYPGSSRVMQALTFTAASAGARQALAVDHRLEEGRRLAGLLAPQGFDGEVVSHSREVLPALTASADYELVLIDLLLVRTNVDELLQQIRRDPRTALLPVGLVAEPEDKLRATRIALRDPLTQVVIRPADAAGLEYQIQRLLGLTSPLAVSPDERLEQARQALAWLTALAAGPQSVYNMSQAADAAIAAINRPPTTVAAALLVADLGSPQSQLVLVNVASQAMRPVEDRQAAADAFRHSVERYGILLAAGEILRQYDRYNQSEMQPKETQQVLASILDTLESQRPPAGGKP